MWITRDASSANRFVGLLAIREDPVTEPSVEDPAPADEPTADEPAEDGKSPIYDFIASTSVEDRYGDVIAQDTWLLERYLSNPVVLWCHASYAPPIGRGLPSIVDDHLEIGVEFDLDPVNQLGIQIESMVRRKFIKAVSVGFICHKATPRNALPEDHPYYVETVDQWQWVGAYLEENELTEVSLVSIPANPEALAKAAREAPVEKVQKELEKRLETYIQTAISKTLSGSNLRSILRKELLTDRDNSANEPERGLFGLLKG